MFVFCCPHCDQRLKAKDDPTGRLARCTRCQQAFRVSPSRRTPDAPNPAAPAAAIPASQEDNRGETLMTGGKVVHPADGVEPGAASSYSFLARAQEADELGRLGRYRVLRRLGSGGMGVIFLAEDSLLKRRVALKVIRNERLTNADALRRFQREIQATGQLSHPNVVHALDADHAGDIPFIVMEYVEGTDLATLIKECNPLPVRDVCDYVRQAALGLQHAHERGLVHRDVKPSNLLLTPDGTVKVLDLGLARLFQPGAPEMTCSELTQEGSVVGTPDYIAPEQALDPHVADSRADLYSLGCTLYHLLTGRVPFPGGSLGQKIARHLVRQPVPVEKLRPDISPEVAVVVQKLMAKQPANRYQMPAEVATALAAAVLADEGPRTATFSAEPTGDTLSSAATQPSPTFPSLPTEPVGVQTTASPAGEIPATPKRKRGRGLAVAVGTFLAAGGSITLALSLGRPTPQPPDNPAPPPGTEGHVAATSGGDPTARGSAGGPAPVPAERSGVPVQGRVTLGPEGNGWRVRAPAYEGFIDDGGALASLRVGGVEFLNYTGQIVRGAFFYQPRRPTVLLPAMEQPDERTLTAKGDRASIRYEFGPDTITCQLTNASGTEMRYFVILSPAVTEGRNERGESLHLPLPAPGKGERAPLGGPGWATATWFAGPARLTTSGGNSTWPSPYDRAGGQIWEVKLAPRESCQVVFKAATPASP